MLSTSELVSVAVGLAFTVVVMPFDVVEHPEALVTFTVTTWPLVREVVVKVLVALAAPCDTPFTKNS